MDRPSRATAIRRGMKRRCPRCGEGALFSRGISVNDRCSVCGLVFQPDHGDTWMFMIITDRIPILLGIVLVYFGFRSTNVVIMSIFFALMAIPMILTLPHRQGIALAIDYLVRRSAGDPTAA